MVHYRVDVVLYYEQGQSVPQNVQPRVLASAFVKDFEGIIFEVEAWGAIGVANASETEFEVVPRKFKDWRISVFIIGEDSIFVLILGQLDQRQSCSSYAELEERYFEIELLLVQRLSPHQYFFDSMGNHI